MPNGWDDSTGCRRGSPRQRAPSRSPRGLARPPSGFRSVGQSGADRAGMGRGRVTSRRCFPSGLNWTVGSEPCCGRRKLAVLDPVADNLCVVRWAIPLHGLTRMILRPQTGWGQGKAEDPWKLWVNPIPGRNWRRGGDSNPRYGFRPYSGLANRRLQPLGHLSAAEAKRNLTPPDPLGSRLGSQSIAVRGFYPRRLPHPLRGSGFRTRRGRAAPQDRAGFLQGPCLLHLPRAGTPTTAVDRGGSVRADRG